MFLNLMTTCLDEIKMKKKLHDKEISPQNACHCNAKNLTLVKVMRHNLILITIIQKKLFSMQNKITFLLP